MRIIVVCGMGIGTSIILKMSAEKALRGLNKTADVEVADIASVTTAARTANVVLTSEELAEKFGAVPAQVVVIKDFTSVDEVTEKLVPHIGA